MHHGDISQEAREVLEGLVRHGSVRCVICTSTLAEGVNFPIRTLVLYSVQRRGRAGETEHLLARDIKNLVGRAGRAGATTKALVVCANPDQWRFVEPVARMAPGEPVIGALRRLMEGLLRALAVRGLQLSNQILEGSPQLHTLVDGIDATLVDLVTDELGEETVIRMATELADRTFASRQAAQQTSRQLLRQVFSLRARRVLELRTSGELAQVRVSGAKVRLVDSVRDELLPSVRDWREFTVPVSDELVATMVDWAWRRPELRAVVRQEYRLDDQVDVDIVKGRFAAQVTAWLAGASHREIAQRQQTPVDDVLGLQAQAIGFVLQALVEQAVPLLATFLSGRGIELPDPVLRLPEHLRYGVPSECGCTLSAHGLRHRSAAVQLGNALTAGGVPNEWESVRVAARALLDDDAEQWRARLGDLVFRRTLQDLA
ncbi:MAG: hypothetical protein IT177_11125 [Acidobacteria bacterium]|nr:hypothetical protein [Acidobacteriota bacterium]